MKLYWKLYAEWFSNEQLLSGFNNPVKDYSTESTGKIIDIGCGQSSYLLDFLDSNFELFAIDTDEMQLNYLSDRVKESGYEANRLNYSSNEFSSENFKDTFFDAIIISNLLHFFTKPNASDFISQIKQHCKTGTLISIIVHSEEHLTSKNEITSKSYFKSFYTKSDLHNMFPKSEYEYLYYAEKEKLPDAYETEFLKHWINELLRGIYDNKQIQKEQEKYFKKSRINSLELLVRKR